MEQTLPKVENGHLISLDAAEQTLALIENVRRISPNAVRLAQVVSLAVQVEPELLRKVRLELLPDIDAGAEADLWFCPLVQSENVLSLVLLPEVEEILRQELSQDQKLLDRAWHILQQVHENAPPVIRLEEEIIWLALSKKPDALDIIEQRLQSVIAAMINENRIGLASWAARELPRLPKTIRKTNAFWMLALGAGARLHERLIVSEEMPKDVLAINWLAWILPKDLSRIPVGVRLLVNGIEFGPPSMPGAHIIELPKTNPLFIEISWWEEINKRSKWLSWFPDHSLIVEVGQGPITLQTSLGEVYILQPQQVMGTGSIARYLQEQLPKKFLLEVPVGNVLEIRSASSPQVGYCYGQEKELIEIRQWIKEDSRVTPHHTLLYEPYEESVGWGELNKSWLSTSSQYLGRIER